MALSIFLLYITLAASTVNSLNEADDAEQCRIVPIKLLPEIGKTYWLGTHSKKGSVVYRANWYEASVYCRLLQMTLATIESSEEYEHFKDTAEKSIEILKPFVKAGQGSAAKHLFWTDATNIRTNEERLAKKGFYWMSTSQQLDFNNWKSREQPIIYDLQWSRASQESCVNVEKFESTYTWNSDNCTDLNYFVCQSYHVQ